MRAFRRRTSTNTGSHPIYSDYREVVHYWMLQLLIPLGAHKNIISERHCIEDEVLHELGLSHFLEAGEFKAHEARQALRQMHSELNFSVEAALPRQSQLAKNIRWVGKIIGLNKTEQSILHFRVIASRHLTLRLCLDNLGRGVDLLYAANILSLLLNVDEAEVEQAFKPGSRLIRTGLIYVRPALGTLMDKVSLLSGFADNLFTRHDDPYSMFSDNFTTAGAAKLTTQDYPHLAEDIGPLKNYRLCLYGPPGTGKSAFGRYLAETLDRPLMVRRASDILSPYVGVAEQNMAKMFREATDENAVLLLDEADTFLRDRKGATRSWEVSEVNEMLTQMESFTGIFIASTNLMGSLDAAAMRRFDMKIKFDYLKPAQAWQLFLDTAARFNIEATEDHRALLDKLHLLTPGDFANVVRQSRLRKIQSARGVIDRLSAECQVKPEGMKRAIGF